MERIWCSLAVLTFAFVLALGAQPVVNEGGVLNAAGYTVAGLPNDGIAQGSMFAVFGQNMGPDELVRALELPLPTDLAGTSIEVTVEGVSVTPFLVYTSSHQLAAVLPSNTPVGEGTLTVTFDGGGAAASNKGQSVPVAIKVVGSAFGIFTRNSAGFGPAIVQNFISPTEVPPTNAFNEPAVPGQVEVLWGTGLGPIEGDDAALPPVGDLPADVEVLIGGTISVPPLYAGRSPQFPAVDQINFQLPLDAPQGCYVPVAVKVNGVVSNYGSIAVAPEGKGASGRYCSDNNFSAETLQTAEQNGELRMGNVRLLRFEVKSPTGAVLEREAEADAVFVRLDLNSLLASLGPVGLPLPPPGACTVFPGDEPPDDVVVEALGTFLDAGQGLDLVGPMGMAHIARSNDGREYGRDLEPDYAQPGMYMVSNGAGGEDVTTFNAGMTVPNLLAFTNVNDLATISRASDLTVHWTGGDPTTEIVGVFGFTELEQAGISFVCTGVLSAGTLTVPAAVLSSLPASTSESLSALAIVGISNREASEFLTTGTGLDLGRFGYFDVSGLVTEFE